MKKSSYSLSAYGKMRDRIKEKETKKEKNKRVPYKFLCAN